MVINTLEHLFALLVAPANVQHCRQVATLTKQIHEVTGGAVEIEFVDQGYTGQEAAQDAAAHDMKLEW